MMGKYFSIKSIFKIIFIIIAIILTSYIILSFADAFNITNNNCLSNSGANSSNWQNNARGDRDFNQIGAKDGNADEEVSYVNRSSAMTV